MPILQNICVYCGSSFGTRPEYHAVAAAIGETFAKRGTGLIYGGANVGLMGLIADTALAHGGRVVGVMPRSLMDREIAHQSLTELHIVDTLHQRKALMADLADGFLTIPGAYGTLDELFDTVTWTQLGLYAKPIGLLNTAGYYDLLLQFLDRCVADGFLRPQNRALIVDSGELEELLALMEERAASLTANSTRRPPQSVAP